MHVARSTSPIHTRVRVPVHVCRSREARDGRQGPLALSPSPLIVLDPAVNEADVPYAALLACLDTLPHREPPGAHPPRHRPLEEDLTGKTATRNQRTEWLPLTTGPWA